MRLTNTAIINAFDSCEWLLEKEVPAALAFALADLMGQLKLKREVFILAVQKAKKTETGDVDPEEFAALCAIETDIDLPKIKKSELISSFDAIPPKVIMALQPLIDTEEAD